MKICIPTGDDRGLEAQAFDHFGSAPYFTLVDTDDEAVQILNNASCHQSPGGCGHVNELAPRGVDTVVCGGMGRGALAGLRAAGIAVLTPAQGSVAEILAAVRAGQLNPMDPRTVCGGGHHGHGHGHGKGGCGGGPSH